MHPTIRAARIISKNPRREEGEHPQGSLTDAHRSVDDQIMGSHLPIARGPGKREESRGSNSWGWLSPSSARTIGITETVSDWAMDPAPLETNEIDLLRQSAAGDTTAFAQLYDRTCRVLFAIARQILRDDALAEDLLQDVYLQVWEKAGAYDPALGKPMTWLITLTRNRAVDRLRAAQRRIRAMEAAEGEADRIHPSGADPMSMLTLDDPDRAQRVRQALAQLPKEQCEAIELAYFGGLTQTEIASRLSVPLGTVKARVRRGLIQMRDAMVSLEQIRA